MGKELDSRNETLFNYVILFFRSWETCVQKITFLLKMIKLVKDLQMCLIQECMQCLKTLIPYDFCNSNHLILTLILSTISINMEMITFRSILTDSRVLLKILSIKCRSTDQNRKFDMYLLNWPMNWKKMILAYNEWGISKKKPWNNFTLEILY